MGGLSKNRKNASEAQQIIPPTPHPPRMEGEESKPQQPRKVKTA